MQERGGQVAAVAILFLILTWVTVGLRCYVRISIVKAFGLDDKLMVLTLGFFTAYLGCQLGGAVHGTGARRVNLTDEQAQTALHYWYFCEIFYTIATCLLKLAVGFFLLRITVQPWHVWIIRMIMAVAAFLGVGYTSLVIFQCKPISYWWDLDPTHEGKCLDASLVMIFTFVVSALNSFADWTFGILPVLIVKDLQMKKRLKVIVSGVIGLAAIGSTATIIRLPYTSTLKPYKGDFLYRTTDFAIWTTVEVGIGITAGCIACLKPLVKSSFLTTWSGQKSTGNPWSKGTASKLGGTAGRQTPIGGLEMKPVVVGKNTTTTTVTAGRSSSDSDEKDLVNNGMSVGSWDNGISKSVTTTVVEERMDDRPGRASRRPKPSEVTIERRRNGSPGGDSASTLHDDERRGPVRAYGAF
ncbi:hypothetical protein DPSP01_006926 [Paraphaeosphaeria sporulosa]|uniref:Integral membrane protein n=1 Tax=Paraphaeosphaeria sporulosa TaxID=1460663 RepID=A0A177CH80_9PLEO|nr:uncharacterized protein CC84DRAFT_1116270 [Paraphaeosphaeria sporulosa]OAG06581.1 integral membrane protein [Paraphaeosphaeria sporulosa]